jgi:menaquinone-specific isochorismate synthase
MKSAQLNLQNVITGLEILKDKFRQSYRSKAEVKSIRKVIIHRLEQEIDFEDIEELLNDLSGLLNLYWSSRDKPFRLIGFGQVHRLSTYRGEDYPSILSEMETILSRSDPGIKYFGGMRFDPTGPVSQEWEHFDCAYFFIPQIEVIRENDSTKLALNYFSGQQAKKVLENLDDLISRVTPRAESKKDLKPKLINRLDVPDYEQWNKNILAALDSMNRDEFQKIVLARKTILKFSGKPNPVSLLNQLIKNSDNAFHFYFKFNNDSAFLGATPELLFRSQDQTINSEAVAGTRPRGASVKEDELLARELQEDDKEIREHRWVSDQVFQSLNEICREVNILEKESVIKLKNVQHLCSRYSGTVKIMTSVYKMIEALHPTPAVGGYPREKTWHEIHELEGFDRGWYAGPVGWIGEDSAEMSVAIRSALINNREVNIYAGAGIVPGSDPEKEWNEIEKKSLNFTNILIP